MSQVSFKNSSVTRPRRIEHMLLLSIALPITVLSLCIAALVIERYGHEARKIQAQALRDDFYHAFANTAKWSSERAFRNTLTDLPWQQAYLQDSQGARVWQQDRTGGKPRWPNPVSVEIKLDALTKLIVTPPALTRTEQDHLQARGIIIIGLSLLLSGLLTSMAYALTTRRIRHLAQWTQQLETGQLSTSAPFKNGLLGAIATSIQVLAQRLRFSRDALQQHSDHSQRRSEAQVKSLKNQLHALTEDSDRIQRRLASRAEFLSAMNHELRTPLTAIMGFSDLLEKGDLSSQQAEYVQTIRKSANGLVSMINDLLDMERIEADQLEIHAVGFDIGDTVEDTISLLTPLAYEKNLELITIVDHDVPARLVGDPSRVQQILTNLVSNAIKFTQHGQVLIRVSRKPDKDERIWVQLVVEDSGRGLSEVQQDSLFTAFQRFEESDSPKTDGSGLGLTIVKKLTDLLGGEIEVSSAIGEGTQFDISLPFSTHQQIVQKTSWEALRGRFCWALEAHDKAWLAQQHLLEFWGINLRRFTSTAELWRTLRSVSANKMPDFIMLGLRADEASEQYIADTLALAIQRPVPAICLVNSVDSAVQRQLKEAGALDVLPKCANRTSLYRACCNLLNTDLSMTHSRLALHGQKVLIAENNPAGRHYLNALLSSLGADVILTEDGQAALSSWKVHKPDFALLDLHMPHMDGQQTTRAIREQDSSSQTIIIGMSAYLTVSEERGWLDSGLNALLPKPFDEDQLVRCLHPWLNRASSPRSDDAHRPRPAKELARDPELAKMMVEELPKQLQELDEAFIAGALEPARAAAHQLHGTAAFFHLEPLKTHVFFLEKRLKDIDAISPHLRLRDDMANVNQAVTNILDQLRTQIAEPPSES